MRDGLIKNHLKKIGDYMALQKEINALKNIPVTDHEANLILGI